MPNNLSLVYRNPLLVAGGLGAAGELLGFAAAVVKDKNDPVVGERLKVAAGTMQNAAALVSVISLLGMEVLNSNSTVKTAAYGAGIGVAIIVGGIFVLAPTISYITAKEGLENNGNKLTKLVTNCGNKFLKTAFIASLTAGLYFGK